MIAILAMSFLLQTPTPESHVWERYSVVGNQHWTSAVTQAEIDEAPKWDSAASDTPPLSPGEAIRAAKKVMEKLTLDSRTGKWHIGDEGVSLQLASHGWIYVVNFEDSPRGCTGPTDRSDQACAGDWGSSGGINIIVLMSGRALVPTQKK